MRFAAPRLAAATAFVAATALALVPSAASAAATTDGNWWYAKYNLAQLHSSGIDGSGVTIAVIDGPVNTEFPALVGADIVTHGPACDGSAATTTTYTEDSGHGTSVASLLVGTGAGPGEIRGIAPKATIDYYVAPLNSTDPACGVQTADGQRTDLYGALIDEAVRNGAEIISISTGGPAVPAEYYSAIARALAAGVVIVAGTPNANGSASTYPWDANGVVAVSAISSTGSLLENPAGTPVINDDVTVAAPGVDISTPAGASDGSWIAGTSSGSSLATPLVAGMLALAKEKYPSATGNQLIQSLIHHASGTTNGNLAVAQGYGYGGALLAGMLSADPASYPDTNPLMGKSSGLPTAQQFAGARSGGASTSSATPSPVPSGAGTVASPESSGGVPIALGAAGLLVVAGLAVTTVLVIRRTRARSPQRKDAG
ncbi:MAG: hypothetical protein ABT08_08985 [Microbacterium sp. SCN 71-21]|uniref:S8 family peptidase n=2 Tax=unclassified Microbacterium TaxID=2609290 RepID=UPI00086A35DE|nr:S8 family serine peptidase [Microbacterium sp. SCN 71-21]ODU76560.1 MAG: hypothetical protein ABT08_08985 [Microbacterium sp. SCN 71-21]